MIHGVPVIHVGRGSSNFFCNLIRAYLKNYAVVHVVASGQYINLSVWVLSSICEEYFTSDMCVGQQGDDVTFMFYVHASRHDTPVGRFVCENDSHYIKVGKYSNTKFLKYLLSTRSSADLVAAGSSCRLLCHMIPHAYMMGFHVEHIQPIKPLDVHGTEKAGLHVYMQRRDLLPYDPLSNMPCTADLPEKTM